MRDKARKIVVKNGSGGRAEGSVIQITGATLSVVAGEVVVGISGGSGSSPLTTNGDLYYYNAGDARLPVGSNGRYLGVSGGLPAWRSKGDVQADLDLEPGVDIMAYDADLAALATIPRQRGDLIVADATPSWTRLPKGSASTLLGSDGTDPQYFSLGTGLSISGGALTLDADLQGIAGLGDGIPVRASGTWSASTADTVVSDAAGANGLVTRTSAGAVTARTITAGDGITVTDGSGVSGNPTIAVQGSVKGFQLYQLFTVIQAQGAVVPNVDGVGATITSAGLYSVNPSETGFPAVQYGDASATGCRFYVAGAFRIEVGTVTTDVLFKMGSDISAGITVVHIGFSSNASLQTADPTGHRYTIRWARGTDTNWQLSTKDNATQTLVDTGVAVTADYYYAVRFVATSSSVAVQISAASTVAAAKSGIDAAGTTSTSSNLPGTGNDLLAIFSMQRSAASTSRCLKFSYWRTIQVPG